MRNSENTDVGKYAHANITLIGQTLRKILNIRLHHLTATVYLYSVLPIFKICIMESNSINISIDKSEQMC